MSIKGEVTRKLRYSSNTIECGRTIKKKELGTLTWSDFKICVILLAYSVLLLNIHHNVMRKKIDGGIVVDKNKLVKHYKQIE